MSVFEIDTKGTCLLCLHSKASTSALNDCCDPVRKLDSTGTAFKILLRYLNIDVMKLSHFSSSVLPSSCSPGLNSGDVNLSVSLCQDCSSFSNEFVKAFKFFEEARLKLEWRMKQLHEMMEKGVKDKERVREFQRRMKNGNMKDLISASIAERLRMETMEKVSRKLKSTYPRISIPSLTIVSPESQLLLKSNGDNGGMTNAPQFSSSQTTDLKNKVNGSTQNILTENLEDDNGDEDQLSEVPMDDVMEEDTQENSSHQNQSCQSSPDIAYNPRKSATNRKRLKSRKPFKCDLCGKHFSFQGNLRTHQFQSHMMSTLNKDRVRVPSSISEEGLIASVRGIVSKSKILFRRKTNSVRECPLCKSKQWQTGLKVHLLTHHLDTVISMVEEGSQERAPILRQRKQNQVDHGTFDKSKNSWRCTECGRHFSLKGNLKTHQLRRHMMTVLKDSLPPSTSKGALLAALKRSCAKSRIISKVKATTLRECHWCKSKQWQSALKVHLLTSHLNEVIAQMEEGGDENGDDLEAYGSRSETVVDGKFEEAVNSWRCNPCGKLVAQKGNLELHQYRMHMMTVLKDRLPDLISQENMNQAVKEIVAKTTIVRRTAKNVTRVCNHCKSRQVHMKFHLLKFHLDKVIPVAQELKLKDSQNMDSAVVKAPCQRSKASSSRKKLCMRVANPTQNPTSKYTCNSCSKVFFAESSLKRHCQKKHLGHLGSTKPKRKCDFCQRWLSDQSSLRAHQISIHPVLTFADRLPPGVSDSAFLGSVAGILRKCKKLGGRNYKSQSNNKMFRCPHCGHKVTREFHMKVHISRYHLDKVIEGLEAGGGKMSEGVADNLQGPSQQCGTSAKVEHSVSQEEVQVNGFTFKFEVGDDPYTI